MTDSRPSSTFQAEETAPGASGKASALNLGLSERDFTTKVIDRAKARGWKVFHPRPARTAHGWRTAGQGTPQGFPDLVLALDTVVLFVELKSQKGKLTDEQKDWLHHTNGAVWRPQDWPAICKVLDLPVRTEQAKGRIADHG